MRRFTRWLPLLLLLSGLVGCMHFSENPPPGPWHTAYQPINDPESDAFILQTLELASTEYGSPIVPVKKILLRRSKKTAEAKCYRIAENFSLTECVDASNGLFVIYLAVDPEHKDYFPLLAHECAHLLNPYIFDWYMEGFATLFSEHACAKTGRKWSNWAHRFAKSRRKPYALSYRMMRELQHEFPSEFPSIIHFTAPSCHNNTEHLYIDINAWLKTLSPTHRTTALAIIAPYTKVLLRESSTQYHFTIPKEEPLQ